MYYESLLEGIEKGKISQIYSFQGEEEYLKREALERIKKILFQNHTAESLNFRIFYGEDLNYADFLEEISTIPVLSDKKLLVLREGDKLALSLRNKISKALIIIPHFSYLIFFFKKIDKRQKLFQLIQENGEIVYFYPLKDRNLTFWVETRFKERNKKIKREAISFLLDKVGNQLQDLEKEIEKVSLYTGSKVQIELDDLKTASSEYQTQTIYDLIDKIMEKDSYSSLKILSGLIRGKKGTELIGLIYWQYSRIFQAKILQDEGLTPQQIGRHLRIPSFYLSKFLNKLNNFSKEELKGIFNKLLQADLNLKSTRLSPKLTLELLLVSLCAT